MRIGIAGHIVAKSHSLSQAVKMSRYASLININPTVFTHHGAKGGIKPIAIVG